MSRMSRRREMEYADGILMNLGFSGNPERNELTIPAPYHYFSGLAEALRKKKYFIDRQRLDFGVVDDIHVEIV